MGNVAPARRHLGQRGQSRRRARGRSRGTGPEDFCGGIRNAVGLACSRPPANCGARPTSATAWATTWCRTTSRGCGRAATTGGPGSIWATTRTRVTPANARTWLARPSRPMSGAGALGLPAVDVLSGQCVRPAAFPADYRGDIFAAFHGSWNRTGRTGSKVIRVHLQNAGDGRIRGFPDRLRDRRRPRLGPPRRVTVAHDGSLLVTTTPTARSGAFRRSAIKASNRCRWPADRRAGGLFEDIP